MYTNTSEIHARTYDIMLELEYPEDDEDKLQFLTCLLFLF